MCVVFNHICANRLIIYNCSNLVRTECTRVTSLALNLQYKAHISVQKSLLAQMDQTVDVAVRQNRLQYLKSGRSHRLYGAANANAKSARFLGIRDDPAAINGNTRVNNKMVKYVT